MWAIKPKRAPPAVRTNRPPPERIAPGTPRKRPQGRKAWGAASPMLVRPGPRTRAVLHGEHPGVGAFGDVSRQGARRRARCTSPFGNKLVQGLQPHMLSWLTAVGAPLSRGASELRASSESVTLPKCALPEFPADSHVIFFSPAAPDPAQPFVNGMLRRTQGMADALSSQGVTVHMVYHRPYVQPPMKLLPRQRVYNGSQWDQWGKAFREAGKHLRLGMVSAGALSTRLVADIRNVTREMIWAGNPPEWNEDEMSKLLHSNEKFVNQWPEEAAVNWMKQAGLPVVALTDEIHYLRTGPVLEDSLQSPVSKDSPPTIEPPAASYDLGYPQCEPHNSGCGKAVREYLQGRELDLERFTVECAAFDCARPSQQEMSRLLWAEAATSIDVARVDKVEQTALLKAFLLEARKPPGERTAVEKATVSMWHIKVAWFVALRRAGLVSLASAFAASSESSVALSASPPPPTRSVVLYEGERERVVGCATVGDALAQLCAKGIDGDFLRAGRMGERLDDAQRLVDVSDELWLGVCGRGGARGSSPTSVAGGDGGTKCPPWVQCGCERNGSQVPSLTEPCSDEGSAAAMQYCMAARSRVGVATDASANAALATRVEWSPLPATVCQSSCFAVTVTTHEEQEAWLKQGLHCHREAMSDLADEVSQENRELLEQLHFTLSKPPLALSDPCSTAAVAPQSGDAAQYGDGHSRRGWRCVMATAAVSALALSAPAAAASSFISSGSPSFSPCRLRASRPVVRARPPCALAPSTMAALALSIKSIESRSSAVRQPAPTAVSSASSRFAFVSYFVDTVCARTPEHPIGLHGLASDRAHALVSSAQVQPHGHVALSESLLKSLNSLVRSHHASLATASPTAHHPPGQWYQSLAHVRPMLARVRPMLAGQGSCGGNNLSNAGGASGRWAQSGARLIRRRVHGCAADAAATTARNANRSGR